LLLVFVAAAPVGPLLARGAKDSASGVALQQVRLVPLTEEPIE